MATLQSTTINNDLTVGTIQNSSGQPRIETSTLALKGYSVRRILAQVHTGTFITSATRRVFTLGHTFPEILGFKAGSLIELSFHIPTRNDNTLWGGIFIEPQVRFNLGSWYSLGGTGYDHMYHSAQAISSYFNSILFDPQQVADFSIQFQFYLSSHDGSTTINGSHSLETRSDAVSFPDLPGNNSLQHYWNIQISELAVLSG